jgi:hypothetical protein
MSLRYFSSATTSLANLPSLLLIPLQARLFRVLQDFFRASYAASVSLSARALGSSPTRISSYPQNSSHILARLSNSDQLFSFPKTGICCSMEFASSSIVPKVFCEERQSISQSQVLLISEHWQFLESASSGSTWCSRDC